MILSENTEKFWRDMTSPVFLKEMKHMPVPEDVIYVPSVDELEALDVAKSFRTEPTADCRFRSDTATDTTKN